MDYFFSKQPMANEIIPSQTGLTFRRTDTLLQLTNKLLATPTVKGVCEMSDDELWAWWCELNDEWKEPFQLSIELDILFDDIDDDEYNNQTNIDWSDKVITLKYIKTLLPVSKLLRSFGKIQDISVLCHLKELNYLHLSNNEIKDISVLSNLTKLTELYLNENQIEYISPLANLNLLNRLNLSHNHIKDISTLANLTQLTELDLSHNPINQKAIDWLRQQLPNCCIEFEGNKYANASSI